MAKHLPGSSHKPLGASPPPLRVPAGITDRKKPMRKRMDMAKARRGGPPGQFPVPISSRSHTALRLPQLDPAPTAMEKLKRGLNQRSGIDFFKESGQRGDPPV